MTPNGNSPNGKVSFELNSGEAFTLQFDVDAVCLLEDLLDKSVFEVSALMSRGRITAIRAALWAGLQHHHSGLSLKRVGEMMPRIKDTTAFEVVSAALRAAYGKPEEAGADAPKDPPQA